MLIRLFADLHYHEWPEFSSIKNGRNSRLQDQVDASKRLASQPSTKFGRVPDLAIVAGDITHKRGALTPAVIKATREVFQHFAGVFHGVYVIPGNHDYPMKNGPEEINSLVCLENSFPGVTTFNRGCVFKPATDGSGPWLGLLPWHPDSDFMKFEFQRLAEEKPNGPGILVSHLAIQGAKLDNGFIYEGGLEVKDLYPEAWNAVFLGDFHHAQSPGPNVHYIGAPYPMTRSDVSLHGGVLDVSIDDSGKVDMGWTFDTAGKRMIRTASLEEAKSAAERGHYVSYIAGGKADAAEAVEAGVAIEFRPPDVAAARMEVGPGATVDSVIEAYFTNLKETEYGGRPMQAAVKSLALEVLRDAQKENAFKEAAHIKTLTIGEIYAENFLSYEKLSINLDNQGLVLVEGVNEDDPDAESNGAGKSALIEAVVFLLFGETLRGVPVAELQRKGVKDPLNVSGVVYVDGSRVDIKRTRSGSKSGFGFSVDQRACHHSSNPAQAQKELDELTGWNLELFRQVAIFGQNSEFNFSCATDAQRKDLLEKLIPNAQSFAAVYPFAVSMQGKVEQIFRKVTAKKELAEFGIADEEKKAEHAREKASVFDLVKAKDLADLNHIIQNAKTEDTARREDVTRLRKAIETAEAERKELLSESSSFEEGTCRDKLTDFRLKIQAANLECDAEQKAIAKLEREAEDLMLKAGSNCPTCKQEVKPEHAEAVAKKAEREINDRRRTVERLNGRIEALETEQKETQKACDEARERANLRKQTLHESESLVSKLRREEAVAQAAVDKAETILSMHTEREAEIKNRVNTWMEVARQSEEKVTKLREEIAQLDSEIKTLTTMKETAEHVSKLYGNQGLKTFLFDSMAPLIQQRANEALAILSSGSLSVELKTERRGQNEKVVLAVGNEFGAPSMKGQSGGQRRKIDIALNWAMASLVEGRINVWFVDEAFDALDAVAGSRVAELLKTRQNNTILNITHRTEFKDYFPHVWTVRLKNGGSLLEREPNANTCD